MTNQTNGTSVMLQGRLVWVTGSDLMKGKAKTDYNTKQVIIGADGQPKVEYGFGLAIPKIDPATGQHTAEYVKAYQALHGEAQAHYAGAQIPPNFALKYKDGDTDVDQNGKPYSDREGYAGHIVISCLTLIPINYFRWEGNNNVLVNTGFKNGDYVNVQLNIKAHGKINNGNPGLYVNPNAVQFIQEGAAIINSPSGDDMFGQAAPAYAGQVVAPTAPQMPGQVAPAVAPMAGAPVAPQMPQAAAMAPQAPAAAPHYNVLPANMQPGQVAPNVPAQPAAPTQMAPTQAPVMPGQASGYAAPAIPSNVQAGQVPNAAPAMPPVYGQ